MDKRYLVYVYLHKSGRLTCTTDVYDHLRTDSPYQKNDTNQYMRLIPRTENFKEFTWGDPVQARVIQVREDGKLDLSPRRLSCEQMNIDAEVLINAMNGVLPLNEKARPKEIERVFHMSKAAFTQQVSIRGVYFNRVNL